MWITCVPLVWLVTVTFTAGWQKIFSPLPAIGFLAQADKLGGAGAGADRSRPPATLIFNARLDAVVCGILLVLVATILRRFAARLGGNSARHARRARARSAVRAVATAGGGTMSALRRFGTPGAGAAARTGRRERLPAAPGRARPRSTPADEWRRFSEERLRAKYARAKCC